MLGYYGSSDYITYTQKKYDYGCYMLLVAFSM